MKKLCYLFFILLMCFLQFACDKENPNEIISVEANTSLIDGGIKKKYFTLDHISLIITYRSGNTDEIFVTNQMVSEEDYAKLQTAGTHEITINFHEFSEVITVKILPDNGYVKVNFYVEGNLYKSIEVEKYTDLINIPSVPEKAEYDAKWDVESFINLEESIDVNAIYTPKGYVDRLAHVNSVLDSIEEKYSDKIYKNIELISLKDEVEITWKSSNENVLSSEGIFYMSKEVTEVTFDVSAKYYDVNITRTITINVVKYKSLENGIASGYVYRSYDKLDNNFYDTMDIIYCAFVDIDVNGGFTGQESDGKTIGTSRFNSNMAKLSKVVEEAHKRGTYVIPSLGGGGSVPKNDFEQIVVNPTAIQNLTNNVVELINKYHFDGVDLDWEYPSKANITNFTVLSKSLYDAIKANNSAHLLTAAIGAGMWQPNYYDLKNSGKYLDYVNVMSYGMCSDSGYYHNALYSSTSYADSTAKVGKTLTSCSIAETVKVYADLNVGKEKLIFGLAFYGVKQEYTNGAWKSKGSVYYTSIKNDYLTSGEYTYHYDTKAQVPYLLSNDKKTFVSYDDPTSILAKCDYVLKNGIAGVMYWENGCDLTGDLVGAINKGLNK